MRDAFLVGMTVQDPGRSLLEGLRLLLVDDETLVRAPIARYLRRRGAWVIEAGDGAHALTRLERDTFDAVITDVRMPVMDGMALLTELERRRHPMAVRTMVLTGDEAALAALRADPVMRGRVFPKPVEMPALEAAIAVVVCSSATGNSTSATAWADR